MSEAEDIELGSLAFAMIAKIIDAVRAANAGTTDPKVVVAKLQAFDAGMKTLDQKDDADADAAIEAKFGKLEPKPSTTP